MIWVVALLPTKVLYVVSDLLYVFVYHIFRYRRKIVRENLLCSFPDKTKNEILATERRFYHFFVDVIFEIIKTIHLNGKDIQKRMVFLNPEIAIGQMNAGKSILFMSSHFGNWEWLDSFALLLPENQYMYNVYRRLKSQRMDAFMNNLRSKFKGNNVEKHDILRAMVRLRSENKVAGFGMISDQKPSGSDHQLEVTFLNQPTYVLTGSEQLARKFDYPVLYVHMKRVKRGYYEVDLEIITTEPKKTEPFEISKKYMNLLEQDILQQPECWLWSHNRWKHSRNKM